MPTNVELIRALVRNVPEPSNAVVAAFLGEVWRDFLESIQAHVDAGVLRAPELHHGEAEPAMTISWYGRDLVIACMDADLLVGEEAVGTFDPETWDFDGLVLEAAVEAIRAFFATRR